MSLSAVLKHASSYRAHYSLRDCRSVGSCPRVLGRLWIHGEGEVRVGNRVFFDAANAPIELYPWPGAVIELGDDVYLGGGTSIEATASIVIGARAHIGAFCKIMDNHFHPLVGDRRSRPQPRPVRMHDNVALGPRSIVLAGADIASGARFAAGSVIGRSPRPTVVV